MYAVARGGHAVNYMLCIIIILKVLLHTIKHVLNACTAVAVW